nr:hypothetical protein [Candidatus Freyarchaeota archaeon]
MEQHICIRKHQLQTIKVDPGKRVKLAGFTGTLKYLLNSTEEYAPWINILTRYATTANTGAKKNHRNGSHTKNRTSQTTKPKTNTKRKPLTIKSKTQKHQTKQSGKTRSTLCSVRVKPSKRRRYKTLNIKISNII